MSIDYRTGDTRDLIAQLPDGSVSLVASSPPFLALRSYLPADHDAKHAEIGSEPDPATFLDTLLDLTAEWGRVLAPWGSIAIELGDTYAGSGGITDNRETTNNGNDLAPRSRGGGPGWPRAKSLALIPQLYATSLAYGRNLLTGQPSPAGQWLVRNVVVWHRPNPAVGALGDKYRPSTSYITVATRNPKRWFDLTAVRTEYAPLTLKVKGQAWAKGEAVFRNGPKNTESGQTGNPMPTSRATHAGAPPLDCWFDYAEHASGFDHDSHDTWTLTTQPSRLAHYAMWPPKLAERLVLSMCPEWVCGTCGEPRRRVERTTNAFGAAVQRQAHQRGADARDRRQAVADIHDAPEYSERETLGWTDCGHDNYQPGVVLDPFAGTGTTPIVAHLHNRTGIGFDLDPRNAELVKPRTDEVKRALFGTTPELPGQEALFA